METPAQTDLCFVLRAIPYQERDLVVVLLSERRGKISAIARNGVQSRRFGASLGLFAASDFLLDARSVSLSEISDERLIQISSAVVRETMDSFAQNFEKLAAASCMNEILLRGLPGQRAAPEIFKLYSNGLIAIDQAEPEQALKLLNSFILKFTQWLGVQPTLTKCRECKKTITETGGDEVFPEVSSGTWMCGGCASSAGVSGRGGGLRLSKDALADAYQAMLQPMRKINFGATLPEHQALFTFLEQHLLYHVPGLDKEKLKSARFLNGMGVGN